MFIFYAKISPNLAPIFSILHEKIILHKHMIMWIDRKDFTKMSYGIVRVQKISSGSVKGIEIHNRREKEGVSHTNKDIN